MDYGNGGTVTRDGGLAGLDVSVGPGYGRSGSRVYTSIFSIPENVINPVVDYFSESFMESVRRLTNPLLPEGTENSCGCD